MGYGTNLSGLNGKVSGPRACRAAFVCLFVVPALLAVESARADFVLWEEDFESVTLGPFVEEVGDSGDQWTNVPPPGWTTDHSGVPGVGDPTTDGVFEWSNWAFVNKDGWISANDQGRSSFTFASGNVMIADPDAWDDQDGDLRNPLAQAATPDNLYDVIATTPVVAIPATIPAGRLKFSFDSSWRGDEFQDDLDGDNNQRATITAIYDGGTRKQVLTWDSDPTSDDLNLLAENQRIRDLDLQFDGSASTVQLEFSMTDAWNDGWWAVDNVLVSVPTQPAVLNINTAGGDAFLAGGDLIASRVTGIDIISPSGKLHMLTGGGLTAAIGETVDGPDAGSTAGDSPGEQWERLTSSTTRFAEAFLHGESAFDSSRSESLGKLVNSALLDPDPVVAAGLSDIRFSYSLATGAIVDGIVQFFFEMPTFIPGDLNGDDVVNFGDLSPFVLALTNILEYETEFPGLDRVGRCDVSGDGGCNFQDLSPFQTLLTGGPGSGSSHVPEPSSACLLALAVLSVMLGADRRASSAKRTFQAGGHRRVMDGLSGAAH